MFASAMYTLAAPQNFQRRDGMTCGMKGATNLEVWLQLADLRQYAAGALQKMRLLTN